MQPLPIVYEDEEIYIIVKPQGLACQGGKGVSYSVDTLAASQLGGKVYLVHRLDIDTGGLMILARTSKLAHKWTTLIACKALVKLYRAQVFSAPLALEGLIDKPIIVKGQRKAALTQYRVLKSFSVALPAPQAKGSIEDRGPNTLTISELELRLLTGRAHQARIHLSGISCPIIGDKLHGNYKLNKLYAKAYGKTPLALYAHKLILPNGKVVTAPALPKCFTI